LQPKPSSPVEEEEGLDTQPSNRDTLVDGTKTAIISHYAQYSGATLLFAKERHATVSTINDTHDAENNGQEISDKNKKV
jgi:hypothetical protein